MKQLEHYLHLYMGCTCLAENGKEYLLHPDVYHWAINAKWKPILRPLSSMTEEEAVELVLAAEGAKAEFMQFHTEDGSMQGKPFGFAWKSDHYRKGQHHNTWYESFEPEGTRYLLSRHFDLFGLIDAGLAIPKS